MLRRLALPLTALLLAALVFTAAAQRGNRTDYLSPELRARVEALKADFTRTPTNRANLAERSKVMYDWINAYSLTGNPTPVNATLWLRTNAAALQGTDAEFAAYLERGTIASYFDPTIREYILKDEQPDAIGRVTISDEGPFQAGSWQTIEQTYTVAKKPVRSGGMVVLGKQLQSDQGLIQVTDPAGDNYVSIHSSKPGVRFEPTTQGLYGMHGGFRGAVPMPAYRVEGGELSEGDAITLVYGDRSGGSRGFRVQTFMNDKAILPVYLDLDGDGLMVTPGWASFAIEGRDDPVRVRGIAPSVVEPNEPFDVSVRTEDRFYNRASGAIPAYEVTLNGKTLEPLPASDYGIARIRDVRIAEPGVYRFGFRSADGKIRGSSNPVWVRRDPSRRLYWGETHAHTGMAEGQGSIEGFYRYGRDEARLDFLGLSEHDIWLDDLEWSRMQRAVRDYTKPGEFVAYLGYEWTQNRNAGGHHNVFFRSADSRRTPTQKHPFLTRLYAGLRQANDTNDVLIIPHAHQAGDWRLNDPEMERLIEIQSMHGTFEWFGNYYLRNGHMVGFLAASDDHKTRPGLASPGSSGTLVQFGGLAAVWAEEKTTDSIFDALRARSAYAATSAERIIVDLEMGGQSMGTRLPMTDERRLRARIMGTAPITEASIVKNGEIIYTKRPSTGSMASKVSVEVAFESSSEPTGRDNPRAHRAWQGVLEVRGAKLVAARPLSFTNPYKERVEIDERDPAKVHFYTETRGRADKMLLELDDVSPSTQLVIRLDQTTEVGGSPVMIRPRATMPARTLRFPFSRLSQGRAVERMPFGDGPDLDTVALELIGEDAPLDYDFDLVDTSEPAWGDYYYVRVTQLNGARAWSSPIWVGGEAPR